MSLAPIVGPADASPSKSVERARQTDASPHSLPPGPETKSDSSSRVALLCVPFDVFVEIAAHLEPVDVLALSRSCSTLRSLLLDEKHKVIWIRARKNVDMPGVTSMSEYEAAALAFDKACMMCDKKEPRSVSFMWPARLRYCCGRGAFETLEEFQDSVDYMLHSRVADCLAAQGGALLQDWNYRPSRFYVRAVEIANEKLWAAEFELGTDGVEAVVKDYVAKAEDSSNLARWVQEQGTKRYRARIDGEKRKRGRRDAVQPYYQAMLSDAEPDIQDKFPSFAEFVDLDVVAALWVPDVAVISDETWAAAKNAILAEVSSTIMLNKVTFFLALIKALPRAFQEIDDKLATKVFQPDLLRDSDMDPWLARVTSRFQLNGVAYAYPAICRQLRLQGLPTAFAPERMSVPTSWIKQARINLSRAGLDDRTATLDTVMDKKVPGF